MWEKSFEWNNKMIKREDVKNEMWNISVGKRLPRCVARAAREKPCQKGNLPLWEKECDSLEVNIKDFDESFQITQHMYL